MSRKLRPEEVELWRQVAERTERLDLGAKTAAMNQEPQFVSAPQKKKLLDTISHATVVPQATPSGRKTGPTTRIERLPSIEEQVSGAKVQMDRKAFDQMKRGKLRPEGRIDLHGMTMDRAHPALTRFILSSQASGRRLVLVITGKGKSRDDGGPIPVRFGVLRHQVPQWMSMPPLSSAILQVSQAHLRHGGAGAYYVYLRRPR